VAHAVLALAVALSAALSAQTIFFPLKDIRPGMRGTGRTVFSGNHIDEFQVEILGLLENAGPKESLIIARLSGGPLEHTGVMQGMSGSPVYIDGKLVGAVAMAFPFAKDPITAIRPIEEMVRTSPAIATASPTARAASIAQRLALAFAEKDLTRFFSRPEPAMVGESRMVDIATPINFGGFTRSALDAFSPRLRALGLEPCQSVTSGASMAAAMGNPADLQPGSMISVQLMAGDYTVAADGTVTYIDGKRLYAFGHRFLDIGTTALPFARSEVITLVPNVNASFKLTTAREWMGTINQDRNTAIAGELGKLPLMVPVSVTVSRGAHPVESYQMRIVDDPLLSPLLTQMAVYSVIDETERTVGAASIRISGEIQFQNALEPVKLNNMYTGDNGTPMQVSLSAAIPLAYVMQSGFDALRLKKIAINVETYDRKKELTIDGVSLSRREVRPGEKVQLNVVLTGQNGTDITRQVEYLVPIGAAPGPLYFTVSDANIANLTDFRQVLTTTPRTAGQVISTVNNLHPNTKAYVRVWRADPAFQLEGADFPDPPASLALILAGSQSSLASITQVRNSKIAQIEVDGGDMVVSGVKTIQVEIKE
jgi:hypothetical protein